MHGPQSNVSFRWMSLQFQLRDLLSSRKRILKEVGIQAGHQVLDYGCGPGSYVAAASELVGSGGRVYALDIHPLAIQGVQGIASRRQLSNVQTTRSGCETGLSDGSVDVVLLYDTFHDLTQPDQVLEELHRVLKPDGILSFRDHHMEESRIVSELTKSGLFSLLRKGKKTYSFLKQA